jgi:hypothetical protein
MARARIDELKGNRPTEARSSSNPSEAGRVTRRIIELVVETANPESPQMKPEPQSALRKSYHFCPFKAPAALVA